MWLVLIISIGVNGLLAHEGIHQIPFGQIPDPDTPADAAQEIRKKWGTSDIIRDIEHIKEDVKKVMKLQELGELTAYEALFYFFRMHDFDDNGRLDGHELMASMRHTMEHGLMGQDITESELVPVVDSFLILDDDNDGFLTYSELRKNIDQPLTTID